MSKKEDDSVGFNNRSSFPHWDNLYANEANVSSLPWYNKNLDDDLREQLRRINITKGRFLDLGTGSATQAIELFKLGFQVTATDISEKAIIRAKRMSNDIDFIVDHIIDSKLTKEPSMAGGPYTFSIDEINSIFYDRFVIESFMETVYPGALSILPKAIFVVLSKKIGRSAATDNTPFL